MAAKRSKIAELVVGFVVSGARQALGVVQQTVGAVATAAKYVSGLGAMLQGGILFKAAKGTQEAYEFSKSIEYLTRVIGQSFAPYLRMVTVIIMRLAQAFRGLAPETQRWIAVAGLAAMAIAAMVALAPVFSAVWAAAGAVIGAVWAGIALVLSSPILLIGLIIAAVGGLVVAFAKLFGFMESGSASASDGINEANASWVGKVLGWIQAVVTFFAKGFNWIAEKAAAVSDFIAEKMADAAEFVGLVPEGTGAMIRTMKPIEPFKLDIDKIDLAFNKMKNGARNVAPAIKQALGPIAGLFQELMQPGNGDGFHVRMKVELEGLQGTFDRLQKAFAEGDGEDVQQQILEQNKAFNQKLDDVKQALVNGFGKLAGVSMDQ